jgi:hypothetical protein
MNKVMRRFLLITISILMTGTPVKSKYCEPDTIQEIDIQNMHMHILMLHHLDLMLRI